MQLIVQNIPLWIIDPLASVKTSTAIILNKSKFISYLNQNRLSLII